MAGNQNPTQVHPSPNQIGSAVINFDFEIEGEDQGTTRNYLPDAVSRQLDNHLKFQLS
jgi:hypothetical protein